MKKFLLMILLCGSLALAQNSKVNIAVLDLDATNIKERDAKFLSDRLRIELFEAGTFNVLERDKMNVILDEQGFQLSGCTSLECAVEIGQLLNVKQMVAGSIGRIGNVFSITLRLINVETGGIERSAKYDYQGELSEMLTEVLPDIALELSQVEEGTQVVQLKSKKKTNGRWGIQIKPGVAVFTVVTDFNNEIDQFNETVTQDLDNLNQFTSFGIIAVWDYDATWRYNFGVQFSTMSKDWEYKVRDYTAINGTLYDRLEFERSFTFSNIYADVDYKIPILDKLNMYFGAGLGLNALNSKVKQSYEPRVAADDSPEEKEFSYVVLAIRLKAGLDYALSENFTLLLEFTPIIQTEYDTVDEFSMGSAYDDFREVLYPETMNGTGAILGLGLTYYF